MNTTLSPKEQFSAKEGFIACLPTVLGYWSVGFSAGVISHLAGLSTLEVALLSALLYAGSGQFIFAQMILSSTTPLTLFSTLFFVNLRHLLMSLYLSQKLPHLSTTQALIIGNHITDESFAVASVQAKHQTHLSFPWMFALNTTAYTNWFLANIAGSLAGNLIPENALAPLQFSLVAMFVGLLSQNIYASEKPSLSIIVALTASITVIPLALLIGPHQSLIPASIFAASFGLLISIRSSKKKL